MYFYYFFSCGQRRNELKGCMKIGSKGHWAHKIFKKGCWPHRVVKKGCCVLHPAKLALSLVIILHSGFWSIMDTTTLHKVSHTVSQNKQILMPVSSLAYAEKLFTEAWWKLNLAQPMAKSLLIRRHKILMTQFIKSQTLAINDWKYVIWSDKSIFHLWHSDWRIGLDKNLMKQ